MSKHKHSFETKYIPEVLVKQGRKRWIVVGKCTTCDYERARDTQETAPTREPLLEPKEK